MKRVAAITLSSEGLEVIRALHRAESGFDLYVHRDTAGRTTETPFDRIHDLTAALFPTTSGFVFVAPTGVVVRAIAPLLRSKLDDPAVVVADVGHRHVISLLSGHEGGANHLAARVANILYAEPVITTASEAKKRIVAGVGCRRGVLADSIHDAILAALDTTGSHLEDLRLIATVPRKADEPGLVEAAARLGVPLRIVHNMEITAAPYAFTESARVRRHLGLPAVAEPCALLAGRRPQFILRKTSFGDVTVALAKENCLWSATDPATHWTVPVEPNRP
jgi:cobalt-precorrin 5A hydrolase